MERIASIFLTIIIAGCVVSLLGSLFLLLRTEVASRNRIIILDAISEYIMDEIRKDRIDVLDVDKIHNSIEEYDSTVNRWWDFGYTRILPKEYFELVKPFIKKKKDGDAK